MANVDAPRGLVPVRHRNGAPYNGAAKPYYLPSSYATAVFIGDCVVKTGTSNTARVTAPGAGEFQIGTLPEVNRTTAGDSNSDAERITGVVVGFAANADDLSKQYNPASTERVVFVADDPDLVFEIQAPTAVTAAQIGLNTYLLDSHSGSTSTGLSGTEAFGTPAADASYQLLIQRQVNRSDNETNAAHNKIEVMISVHTEASGMNTNAIGTLGI